MLTFENYCVGGSCLRNSWRQHRLTEGLKGEKFEETIIARPSLKNRDAILPQKVVKKLKPKLISKNGGRQMLSIEQSRLNIVQLFFVCFHCPLVCDGEQFYKSS